MLEIGDQLIDPGVWVAYAAFALGVPLVFLAIVIGTALRRRSTGTVGPRATALIAGTGGLTLGALLPVSSDVTLLAPIIGAGAFIVYSLWRRLRRVQAGWFLSGLALPSAVLGSLATWRLLEDGAVDPARAAMLLSPVAALIAGAVILFRGEPPAPPADIAAPPGHPGSRSFGSIAEAIRDPARLGPFGVPELTTFVTIVATLLVVPFLLPRDLPALMRIVVLAVVFSAVATETYIRARPSVARRAFEAFSWLGEWELAEARRLTGDSVPTSKRAAAAWLERHPDRAEERTLRVEVLLFVGRVDEARRLLDELPVGTPWERFSAAALRDMVDWYAGGDGDLPSMENATAELLPADGDDHLRAEVSIATAHVRRRMAEGRPTPEEVVQPLLAVRERLGRRADGQIGRALRRRLFPALLIGSILIGGAMEAFAPGTLPPR